MFVSVTTMGTLLLDPLAGRYGAPESVTTTQGHIKDNPTSFPQSIQFATVLCAYLATNF